MAILDFSVSGRHGFGSVTQVCFGISVSDFMCMSFVAVGRGLMIVCHVAFKMTALWFWTMFNCNPPIAHCYPLLWGGGILVDHWSTISSYLSRTANMSWRTCVIIKLMQSNSKIPPILMCNWIFSHGRNSRHNVAACAHTTGHDRAHTNPAQPAGPAEWLV